MDSDRFVSQSIQRTSMGSAVIEQDYLQQHPVDPVNPVQIKAVA